MAASELINYKCIMQNYGTPDLTTVYEYIIYDVHQEDNIMLHDTRNNSTMLLALEIVQKTHK